MRKRQYSTECMISHKPEYMTGEPEFCRCRICGSVTVRHGSRKRKSGREESMGNCCGEPCERLHVQEGDGSEHEMDYCVFGGFSHNAVRVDIGGGLHPMEEEHCIEWMYLYTYQGGQMKYLSLSGESAAVFSLAGEDAYVFCNREVCKMGWGQCRFFCKKGHVAYAYCSRHGLHRIRF